MDPVDDRDKPTLSVLMASEPGQRLRFEIRWRHDDGHLMWTENSVRCRNRLSHEGSVTVSIGVAQLASSDD